MADSALPPNEADEHRPNSPDAPPGYGTSHEDYAGISFGALDSLEDAKPHGTSPR